MLQKHIEQLKKQQQKSRLAGVPDELYRQLRVVPTCPPSTSVRILSGQVYTNASYWFWIHYDTQFPTTTVDFTDTSEFISGYYVFTPLPLQIVFTQANWYVGFILRINHEWLFYGNDQMFWCDISEEFATAGEAEAWVDYALNGGESNMLHECCPVWSFILRNNGTINEDGAVMPVDMVNRGRSYLYRDIRVRTRLVA